MNKENCDHYSKFILGDEVCYHPKNKHHSCNYDKNDCPNSHETLNDENKFVSKSGKALRDKSQVDKKISTSGYQKGPEPMDIT